ncbi:MAG TPA: hypothetical protein VKE40_08005, partial [Gemmataceae bacterium]|nr:hypothetical protein [Gemmataceae bacterium]
NAATRFAAGSHAAVPAGAVAAAEEVITDMLLTKLTKVTAVLLAGVAALGFGFGLRTEPTVAAPATKSRPAGDDLTAALKTARPINVALLEQDEVLTDLKCTPDQRQAIADVIKAARDEYREAVQGAMRKVAGPGGAAVRMTPPPPIKYDTEKLAAALKAEQLIRVRQLELHLKGPHAFVDRRVVRALGLTAEQEAKVEEVIVRYEPEYANQVKTALVDGADGDRADGDKALAELGEKFTADCLKLLTKEQQATWAWLVGKRPEAGAWVRAGTSNGPAGAVGMFRFQGGGGVRVAPVGPAPPGGGLVPPPPLPKK